MSSTDQQPTTDQDNKSSATMNDLPNEMLPLIFMHLRPQDLVKCRLVCKRFMFFCDEVKIPELIVSKEIENFKDYWFHTNEQFNHKDAIDMDTFLRYKSIFALDKWLKRLHFDGSHSDFKLLNLNDLTQLEQLKICIPDYIPHQQTIRIDLPNLKILDLGDESDYHINAPKLERLKCPQIEDVHLTHPNSVIDLDVIWYTEIALKNLRHLKVHYGPVPYSRILSLYPKLTTLISNQFDYIGQEFDEAINGLNDLIKEKKILKRHDLKIYYQSVELIDNTKIDEYQTGRSVLAFQIKNYDLLCDVTYHDESLDYNKLMRLVNGKLPQDFHRKFSIIESVKVTKTIKRPEQFLQFLGSLNYLKELRLQKTNFDQSFYDRLPVEIGGLTTLEVKKSLKPIGNYDFLHKLKCLRSFDTDRDMAGLPDLSLELFRELKFLQSTRFYCEKEFIVITNFTNSKINPYTFRSYLDEKDGKSSKIVFEKRGMDFEQLVRTVNAYKLGRSISSN